jgi:hypothetical protein
MVGDQPTLSYSGSISIKADDGKIPQSERDKLHGLLDKAIQAYEDDQVTLRTRAV